LVRAYLVCIDELTVLGEIFSKKLDFFRRLQQDCDHLERCDRDASVYADNFDGETTTERIAFAEYMMEDSMLTCKRLTADLRESLNSVSQYHIYFLYLIPLEARLKKNNNNANICASSPQLFQLRSIEQNELAIIADTQHKAIFVFTGFTIVFLPLSFFTSYFGMNLKGIINTNRTEEYYWKVCGSVAFSMVLLVCLYAFRYRIRLSFSRYRRKTENFAV
jgi:hypothetical protein